MMVATKVRYVSNHPLLDGWRIISAHSSMDVSERQHAMQSFTEGRVSLRGKPWHVELYLFPLRCS